FPPVRHGNLQPATGYGSIGSHCALPAPAAAAGTRRGPMLPYLSPHRHAIVSMRRTLVAALAVVSLLVAGCREGDVGPRMSRNLDEARQWRAQVEETARRVEPDSAEPILLITLGYLER